MTDLPKLTPSQREPLFALVRFQEQQGQEITFAIASGWEVEIAPWHDRDKVIIKLPKETITVWYENGCISLSERSMGPGNLGYSITTFLLCQEALDYYDWMRKPRLLRGITEFFDKFLSHNIIAGTIAGAIGGAISAILAYMILKALGY